MKKYNLFSILLLSLCATYAQAQPLDTVGGPIGAQTMYHCGYLAAPSYGYSSSPIVVRVLQQKLAEAGYNPGTIDGVYGKRTKNAMKAFQNDRHLTATGMADGQSVGLLAQATHPSSRTRSCERETSNLFR